jgi:hypothetical protein
VETAKRGDALRTTLVLKIGLNVITFLDNFIFFWVPSMKNINLNILKI